MVPDAYVSEPKTFYFWLFTDLPLFDYLFIYLFIFKSLIGRINQTGWLYIIKYHGIYQIEALTPSIYCKFVKTFQINIDDFDLH